MPMHPQEIEEVLRETFPNATIRVSGDDGIHMAAEVYDESFRGLTRVQQQRAVYAAFQGRLEGPDAELHALSLKTGVPH